MEATLDPKTQLLVAVGAAVAAKCQNCFATLYATAGDVGATDREIRAVVAIATKVAGKAQDFMAAFVDATTKHAVAVDRPAAGGGCGCS